MTVGEKSGVVHPLIDRKSKSAGTRQKARPRELKRKGIMQLRSWLVGQSRSVEHRGTRPTVGRDLTLVRTSAFPTVILYSEAR